MKKLVTAIVVALIFNFQFSIGFQPRGHPLLLTTS